MQNKTSRATDASLSDTENAIHHRRPEQFRLTQHALERINQRNLSSADIQYVVRHGQARHVPQGVSYFMGWRHIPTCDRSDDKITRLEGTVVLLDLTQEYVITAWRNRRSGTKQLRCRGRHRRP
jgi:hypothetical protein